MTFTVDKTNVTKKLRFIVMIEDELLEDCAGESLVLLEQVNHADKPSRQVQALAEFLAAEGY